jgi:hypothetical protein
MYSNPDHGDREDALRAREALSRARWALETADHTAAAKALREAAELGEDGHDTETMVVRAAARAARDADVNAARDLVSLYGYYWGDLDHLLRLAEAEVRRIEATEARVEVAS